MPILLLTTITFKKQQRTFLVMDIVIPIAYAPLYKYELPEGHRFPMEKYELLPEQLVYEGTVSESQFFHPDRLTIEELTLTHYKSYYDKLVEGNYTRKEERKIGFPVSANLIERGLHIARGTYQCAIHAQTTGVSLNIAGGTHHAYPDRGEGFCVFNDISIASNLLLERGEAKKILIIDLDVHQGNGNAYIFRNEPRVFTFSMHGAKNYPLRKEKSDLDIGLADKTEDSLYLGILEDVLPRLMDEVQPDMAFYQSGVDILETDKLGRLKVTREGCKRRDEIVMTQCHKNDVPLAVSMGGGYSHKVADIIEAHANTYRMAHRVYS
jgi:acetoin utilization deacetylase AcuC-like enzyme